jgi:hypothetical protein
MSYALKFSLKFRVSEKGLFLSSEQIRKYSYYFGPVTKKKEFRYADNKKEF